MDRSAADRVARALARVSRQVLDLRGVAGTAQGLKGGRPCVKIYIESDDDALRARLPRSADGIPVDVEVTGAVRLLEE